MGEQEEKGGRGTTGVCSMNGFNAFATSTTGTAHNTTEGVVVRRFAAKDVPHKTTRSLDPRVRQGGTDRMRRDDGGKTNMTHGEREVGARARVIRACP